MTPPSPTARSIAEGCLGSERYTISWEQAQDLARAYLAQQERVRRLEAIVKLLRSRHDDHACERPDGPCYVCGKLAEFDAALAEIGEEEHDG